ncbi:Vegetative incompatibility protein HET-E-1 [Ceratobasidium theobromae]|uniref:Vegetative incompatibility protein HET-E-1 n=1 Tax=Ceratobasidium theobromae TaxID=1582974 RepID=A0A5N5Q8M8_9AGAM|nr:Vegetative incompatibility protein HET-E-1 [Ceratobasidium theobromae]
MTSPPTSPKLRKGFRGFIREQYVSFRSHLRSPSHHLLEVPGSRIDSQSPAPRERLNSTSKINETPLTTNQTGETLRRTNSLPALVVDSSSSEFPAIEHLAIRPAAVIVSSAEEPPGVKTGILETSEHISKLPEQTRSPTWAGLGSALRTLHDAARLFPLLQSAIGALLSCLDAWELMMKNREGYEALARELTTLSKSLMQHIGESRSFLMTSGDMPNNLSRSIEEQARSLQEKQTHGMGNRLVGASIDEQELIKHNRKIESLIRQLQTDVSLSTWSVANEQLANTRLEALTPAKSAHHDSSLSMEISRRTCTEGTRTTILSGLDEWSSDPNAKAIYLMSGMAGTGKTTIACSLSEKLEERKQLAASFFCSRTSPECRQVQRIIPTIAYQLARYSIPFQVALCEILGTDPDIGLRNIGKQFERLLKEPLMAVRDAIPDNLVVVIDALDECEDRNAVRRLLDLLFHFAGDIPLRFFVTSRPEPEIYKKMISQTPSSRTILHLHEIEKSLVQADITLYLKEELGSFMSTTPDQIRQLSERSGNLFIYAATLVRYLQLGERLDDHQKRLDSLLGTTLRSTKQYAQLDELYGAVLKSALSGKDLDEEEVEDVQAVLQAVICAQEPVDIETLAALAGIDDAQRARSALQPLRSVLHLSENIGLVSTLHASFPDFMFSQERSGPFFCNTTAHNQVLSRQCFSIMRQLQFNICNLESSFVADKDINDLPDRVAKCISSSLSYACRYWADHLRLCDTSEDLRSMLGDFLSTRLLFWMEVMNLKKVMSTGMEALLKVKQWLQISGSPLDVIRLAEDARKFVTTFAGNPISQSQTPYPSITEAEPAD